METVSHLWPDDQPGPLASGALRLWLIDLAEVPTRDCLSEDERMRAAGAIDPQNGARYRAVRIALRLLLAAALDQHPADLMFAYGATRQPHLAWPPQSGIDFSLSYRADTALIALSRAGPVGIDLETIDPSVPAFDIAASEFAAPEVKHLAALSENEIAKSFTQMWVRKEAIAKLRGEGLWQGLADLPALADSEGQWRDLAGLPEGLAGAYAIQGTVKDLRLARLKLTPPLHV